MAQTVQEMHMETDRKVGEVFRTMILFTIVMVLGPISTYFLTKNYVWESNKRIKIFLIRKKVL